MAEELAPEQTGPGTPTAADSKASRAKFLVNFSSLDPDAHLDDASLTSIMGNTAQRDEFASYVSKLNPKFKMNGQELADALGYGEDLKKNVGTQDGGRILSGNAPQPIEAQPQPIEAQPQPIDNGLVNLPAVAPDEVPQAQPAQALATQPEPDVAGPTPLTNNGLVQAPAFAGGTAFAPLAQNQPNLATGEPATQGDRQPSTEEAAYLAKQPGAEDTGVRTDGSGYLPTPYGKELVKIPNDYTGAVPTGSFPLNLAGPADRTQYFYRDISKKSDGKEQSYGEAIAGKVKNSLLEMAMGGAETAQAVATLADFPTSYAPGNAPLAFGDKATEYLKGKQTTIAPYYNQSMSRHKNWETVGLAAAEYAPMVVAQVAQTLAPELGAPKAIEQVIGLVSSVGFDMQMVDGAHKAAESAGLTGRNADLYTLFVGGLTIGGFKAGSKLMTKLGDKMAIKIAPEKFVSQVSADATERVAKLQLQLGRTATQAESAQILHETLRAAMPKLAQIPKEVFQQAPTFAGVEAVKIGADQLAAPALGGKAQDITPTQAAKQILIAGGGGAAMGAITGTVGAALPTVKTFTEKQSILRKRAPEGTKPVAADQTLAQVKGQTVMVRDNNGHSRLGELRNIIGEGKDRAYVIRDADAKLTRHAQGEVFINNPTDTPEDAVDTKEPKVPATSKLRPASQPEQPLAIKPPGTGPTLAELVTDSNPINLDFGGETVSAFRNQEGDVELHHSNGQVSIIDKGDQFEKPATDFLLTRAKVRVKSGDKLTLSTGEHEIEDILRGPDKKIEAVMIAGDKGSRIIQNDTEEGKSVIDELNAKEQVFQTKQVPVTPEPTPEPAPTPSPAPEPIKAPEPAKAPEPIKAPEPAKAPEPIKAPEPAKAPEPVKAPEPAKAPEPVKAPEPTPEPAKAPEPASVAPKATSDNSAPLPAAEPHPDNIKVLTPEQQARNAALDARDLFNELNKTEQKSVDGKKRRKALIDLAGKAGLKVKDLPDGKATFTDGRVTRSNEYTGTTPANNHVPLEQRPAEARPFIDKMLAGADTDPMELQGLGIKIRGKELNKRELADAAKDIKEGRNTLRAQMVLDTLENANRAGFIEKSTGNGKSTQKFIVPIEDYLSDNKAPGKEIDLNDDEITKMVSEDPYLADAIESYTDPETSKINYEKLAAQGKLGALETFFDVDPETAQKVITLAYERAKQSPTESKAKDAGVQFGPTSFDEKEALAAGISPGGTEPTRPASGSPGPPAPADKIAAPAPEPAPLSFREQTIAAKTEFADAFAEFRAARKKGSGLALASVLGIPTFSREETEALTKMIKAAIKLGAVKTKTVIAQLRAIGFDENDATDDHLKPLIKQLLIEAELRQPKEPKGKKAERYKAENPLDPSNTEESQSAQSLANSGLSDELKDSLLNLGINRYTPKSLAETAVQVDKIIAKEGIDRAYHTAINANNGLPGDVQEVLRNKILTHYDKVARDLRNDPGASADALAFAVERSINVAVDRTLKGTDIARELRARQTIEQFAPSIAVARIAIEAKETKATETEALRPKAKAQAKSIRSEKSAALDAALASDAVQTALGTTQAEPATTKPAAKALPDAPSWGSKNTLFTKESAIKAREALRKLRLATVIPPDLILFLGFHIEAGARSFADVSARALRDLGQKVKPLLPEAYELAKKEFISKGGDDAGFDTPDVVGKSLIEEDAEALADRIVAAAKPAKPGVYDPKRDMLDTLTKKVSEKLPESKGKPREARDLIAHALNNKAEYADIFEASKDIVIEKIDALKISDNAKAQMHDDLQAYHDEIIGQPYADKQFASAYAQAEDEALKNYPGKNRGNQLNAAALAMDASQARDRAAIIAHVTDGVSDPADKKALGDQVGREFDARLRERQLALRNQNGMYDANQTVPPPKPATPKLPMDARVRKLLSTRATNEQVANRVSAEAVREGLAKQGKRLEQIARDHINDPTEIGRSLADAFVRDAGIPAKDAKVFADAITKQFAVEIEKAQEKALNNAYSRKVRTGTVKEQQDLTDKIRKLYTLSPTDESRVLGLVAEQADLPELSKADNTKLYGLAQDIANAKGDNAKAFAIHNFHLAVKLMRGLSGWTQIKSTLYSNLLSGLGTEFKNIISTGINTGADLFYATGWAGFLTIQHAIRNGNYKLSNSELSGDGLRMITGPARAMKTRNGLDRAQQMLATGVRAPGYEAKFDQASDSEAMALMPINSPIGVLRKRFSGIAKYVSRALSANDLMWTGSLEQMWAYNIALTDAIGEGRNQTQEQILTAVNERLFSTSIRLADSQAQATQELGVSNGFRYRIRVQELMEASRDERLKSESKESAAKTAFNGPMEGVIGQLMSSLGSLTEAEMGFGTQPIKGIVPFTRIVANVTNAFLDYTPVGAIRAIDGKIGFENIRKSNNFVHEYSPMERTIVAAKAATGAIVMRMAFQLLDIETLSGSGPSAPAENRAWLQQGHRPYNIMGFNYKDSSLYFCLAAVASIKEAQYYDKIDFENDKFGTQRALLMTTAAVQASFGSLSLTNLQDLLNAISDPSKGKNAPERFSRYVGRTVGAVAGNILIPFSGFDRSALRMYQQFRGQTKREGNDGFGMLAQDIPELRDQLPRVYDNLGNEVPVGSNIPGMPIPESSDKSGATKRVNEFLHENNLTVTPINRFQDSMMILKGRVGKLTKTEKARVDKMTEASRKKYLINRLGGEAAMTEEQWATFYPTRGRLIKEAILLALPKLEKYAKTNPRLLRSKLNFIYTNATKKARKGTDFSFSQKEDDLFD